MELQKWNYQIHKYEKYIIPNNWKCKTYSNDMEEIINCPHCGKQMKFGEGYTSMEIHTEIGFGYSVCKECYEKEWERRRNEEQ